MKIIDRQAFLAIVPPVLYTKMHAGCDPDESLWIKCANDEPDDWLYTSIDAVGALECSGYMERADMIQAMESDPSVSCPVDYAAISRDGLHEGDEVKFVVFEKQDIERLSARFSSLLSAMS